MKPRDLILIVAIGTSLIVMAPTAQKAGQADKGEMANVKAQDVKVTPAQEEPSSGQAKIVPASFDGDTQKLAEH